MSNLLLEKPGSQVKSESEHIMVKQGVADQHTEQPMLLQHSTNTDAQKPDTIESKMPDRDQRPVRDKMMNTGSDRPELTLQHYRMTIPGITVDETCGVTLQRFRKEEQLPCIAVCNEAGEPTGLIMREQFYRRMASRFATELYEGRPTSRFTRPDVLSMDIHTDAATAVDAALVREGEAFYECVLLTENGQLAGAITIRDMMELSRHLQALAEQQRLQSLLETRSFVGQIEEAVQTVTGAAGHTSSQLEAIKVRTVSGHSELGEAGESFRQARQLVSRQRLQTEEMLQHTVQARKVLDDVSQLAGQSTMLALNASIEAARAAQAGSGFAVVAGEMRHLSSRITTLSADVTRLLNGLNEMIAQSAQYSQTTEQTMERSLTSIAKADRLFAEMAAGADEASAHADQLLDKAAEAARLTALVTAGLQD
ncbi:methyl-accepting chemotaxis protein [Paenibacillus sp. Z6-24]